jgi:hypothetical protein
MNSYAHFTSDYRNKELQLKYELLFKRRFDKSMFYCTKLITWPHIEADMLLFNLTNIFYINNFIIVGNFNISTKLIEINIYLFDKNPDLYIQKLYSSKIKTSKNKLPVFTPVKAKTLFFTNIDKLILNCIKINKTKLIDAVKYKRISGELLLKLKALGMS